MRYRPISQQITAAVAGVRTKLHERAVDVAKRRHAEILQTDPRPGRWRQWVDGVEGAAFDRIKMGGNITVRYSRLDIVVQFAMEVLFDRSPVESGLYRNSHVLYVNGVPAANLKDWEPGDEITISNTVPYSRKIERGAMRMRLPGSDHVYQATQIIVRSRFGRLADVGFTYRGFVSGAQVNPANAAATITAPVFRGGKGRFAPGSGARLRGGEHNVANVRFPTLIINEPGTFVRSLGRRR